MNFDGLGEHVAREQDAIRAQSSDRAEVGAELEAIRPLSLARRARPTRNPAHGGARVAPPPPAATSA